MRKISLFITLLFSALSYAATVSHSIVKATNTNDDVFYYYYDAQNRLVQQICNATRYDYFYNEVGQCIRKQTMMWVAATGKYTAGNYELYEYDANGNVSKTTVMKLPWNATEYVEDDVFTNYTYEDGFQKTWDNYYHGTLYYNYRNIITKNDAGEVVSVATEQFDPDAPEKGWTPKTGMQYVWADLSSELVPSNLTLKNNNGEISLTWNAVNGAESYFVTYDQTRVEVKNGATSFSATLGTGNHCVAVQAVIDGKARNSAFTEVEVSDPGKLPVENLTAGKCFLSVEETESTEAPTREFYNIPLTWTIPQGHSEIKSFRVYYDSRTFGPAFYQIVESSNATGYTLKVDPYELRNIDEGGNLTTGITTPIYVTVMYGTGESEKSNVITVNPYNDVVSGIDEVYMNDNVKDRNIYNVAGQRIDNMKGLVIKNGKKYIK